MGDSRKTDRRPTELVLLLEESQGATRQDVVLLDRFRRRYAEAPADERRRFFEDLVRRLEVPREAVAGPLSAAMEAPDETRDPVAWSRRLTELRRAIESPRLRAFRRFLNAPGGLRFLLDLRADILEAQREHAEALEPLEEEIAHLVDGWFHHGFLFLQEVTPSSPFRQIAYLRNHELVHPLASLEEMAHRLGGDRRCFALHHVAMPDEPVVFIEVALTRGLAESIHDILPEGGDGPAARKSPDTAIFYSINNTQTGLAGLGLGAVLISRVVETIRTDTPGIGRFATLSPIPGFWPRYLRPLLRGETTRFSLARDEALDAFPKRSRDALLERTDALVGPGSGDFGERLAALLDRPAWIEDEVCLEHLRRPLLRLGWSYLSGETTAGGRPLNPVARFHLGNGARVSEDNVRFAANRSARGLSESCGLMVNYVYSLNWMQRTLRRMRELLPRKG